MSDKAKFSDTDAGFLINSDQKGGIIKLNELKQGESYDLIFFGNRKQ